MKKNKKVASKLISFAKKNSVEPAVLQNGSAPTDFMRSHKDSQKGNGNKSL